MSDPNPKPMIKTTRPVFPTAATSFKTDRLLLRPFQKADLAQFHSIRSNAEVMYCTVKGVVDADEAATQVWMDNFLPPNNAQKFVFALEALQDPGQIIGSMAVHSPQPPEIGYSVRREQWQKGYATEALTALLTRYWALERKEVEVEDDLPEVERTRTENGMVKEHIIAYTAKSNPGSCRVLEKNGFKRVPGREVQVEDFRGPEVLIWYYIEKP